MQERALSTERVFEGRLLKIDVVSVELDDGTRASREIVRHPGAAVVLCRKPDGRFLPVSSTLYAEGFRCGNGTQPISPA